MKRSCEACGKKFTCAEASKKRFCDDLGCRRARARGRKQAERAGTVVDLDAHRPPAGESVEEAVRSELKEARKLSSSIGQSALALARQLDSGLFDTGSSKAALARELHSLMLEATRDVKRAADPVDELQAKRRRRLGLGA